jgi:cyclopropane fatty-acyl-phospholipid synthase-like methyltransferase
MDSHQDVRAAYDQIAEQYLASKNVRDPALLDALAALGSRVGPDCRALDLGCGAGIPTTAWLAQRCDVTGVDLSPRQLELARANVPSATLCQASMTDVDFPPESFDIVVAFHSIIHVPREEQPALLQRINGWLRPDGLFLATWSTSSWEGSEQDWMGWGAPMWWSHFDAETNLAMLQHAGFSIETADRRTSGDETWLWVLARKAA